MGNKKNCAFPLKHKGGTHWKSLLFTTLSSKISTPIYCAWTINIAGDIFKVFLSFLSNKIYPKSRMFCPARVSVPAWHVDGDVRQTFLTTLWSTAWELSVPEPEEGCFQIPGKEQVRIRIFHISKCKPEPLYYLLYSFNIGHHRRYMRGEGLGK